MISATISNKAKTIKSYIHESVFSLFFWWIESLLNFACHSTNLSLKWISWLPPFLIVFVKIQILIRAFKAYVDSSFPYIQPKNKK